MTRTATAYPHGRKAELSEIERRIQNGARLVVLKGMAGVGKTALAQMTLTHLRGQFVSGARDIVLDAIPRTDQVVMMMLNWFRRNTDKSLPYEYQEENFRAEFKQRKAVLLILNYEKLLKALKRKSGKTRQRAEDLFLFLQSLLGGNGVLLVGTQQGPTKLPGEDSGLEVQGVDLIAGLEIYKDHAAHLWTDGEEQILTSLRKEPEAEKGLYTVPKQLRSKPLLKVIASLDGHPLAIKLLAGAVAEKEDSLDEVLKRLPKVLHDGESYGAKKHHQNIDACIAYALESLDAVAKKLLSKLCIFHGRFESDAVKAIGPANTAEKLLSELVRKHVVRQTVRSDIRYYSVRPVIRWTLKITPLEAAEQSRLAAYHCALVTQAATESVRRNLERVEAAQADLIQTFESFVNTS